MIEVQNVDSNDIDVNPLIKSTNISWHKGAANVI